MPYIRTLTDSEKASLCGHYEVVQVLLESGALCERDTFQGNCFHFMTALPRKC